MASVADISFGFGASFAKGFARHGDDVMLTARRADRLEAKRPAALLRRADRLARR